MPKYGYYCDKCKIEIDVVKPMAEAGSTEMCTICGGLINRIWYAPNAFVSKGGDEWNTGLKCKERDKRDTLRKIKAETGRDLIEVGNERLDHIKPKTSNYDFTSKEMREIGSMIDA